MKTCTKFLAGAVTILALAMIGCQTDTDTHEHTYSTDWTSDATSHWHAATCGHTTEVSDKAVHTFGEAVVTKETKTYTFTVCNYQRSVAVGDIIYTDGTTSSKDAELTSGKTPVAVVAGFNTNGAILGLGLKQSSSGLKWAPRDTTGYGTKFTEIIAFSDKQGDYTVSTATFTGDTDGSDNWKYVKSIDPEGTANAETNYPAFNFAATYATTVGITGEIAEGWYLPSIAELTQIYRNKDVVNSALSKCNGMQISKGYYWSSSQSSYLYNAWALGFSFGDLYSYGIKDNGNYVCCVRAF